MQALALGDSLGNSKAYSDGLDREVMLYYQQALRCRTIESVEQHSLNDIGINILLQARLQSQLQNEGRWLGINKYCRYSKK